MHAQYPIIKRSEGSTSLSTSAIKWPLLRTLMAEMIQFHCPACRTLLRLPLELAAQKGPCPTCRREIIAPDPYRGIGAFEVPAPLNKDRTEPFTPFVESPPLVPMKATSESPPVSKVDVLVAEETPLAPPIKMPPPAEVGPLESAEQLVKSELKYSPSPAPQKTILVLSCLLSFAVALAMGYALGVRSTQYFMRVPPSNPFNFPSSHSEKPATPQPPTQSEPTPIIVKPIIQKTEEIAPVAESPKPEKITPPVKVSAAAEASLRAFLEAPDWATRNAHVLFPNKIKDAMEAYSHEVPDGPTAYKSISVKQSQTDETTGNTLFIFQVSTEKFPSGIPVAILETPRGWLVDWRSFVEFRDDQFKQFVDGPAGKTGRFHVIVRTPPPAHAANTMNEYFSSYLLDPPMPGRQQLAFVKKSSAASDTFNAATQNSGIFTPVLEVKKLKTPDGQNYLEITKIIANDWLPRDQ